MISSGDKSTMTLPWDVLSEIFSVLLPFPEENDSTDTNSLPWSLGRVCSSWRSLSNNLPELWSSINIPESSQTTRQDPARLLELQLKRSKNHPLTIRIMKPTPRITRRLMAHSRRWKSLYVFVGEKKDNIFDPIEGKIPLLEELTFLFVRGAYSSLFSGFSRAPRLRKVITSSDGVVRVPFKGLEYFSGGITGTIHDPLENGPNLQVLRCWEVGRLRIGFGTTTLRHEVLQKLSILNRTFHIRSLILPNLRHLDVAYHPTTLLADVLEFLRNSRCPLSHFSISLASMTEAEFTEFCQLVPGLRSLRLEFTHFGHAICRAVCNPLLVHPNDAGNSMPFPLLPELEDFSLLECNITTPSLGDDQLGEQPLDALLLESMLLSRCLDTGKAIPQDRATLGRVARLKKLCLWMNAENIYDRLPSINKANEMLDPGLEIIPREIDSAAF